MRHVPLRLVFCYLVTLANSFAADPVKPPTDPGKFELYLLVGQSNMSGRGKLTPADAEPDARVLVLDAKNEWGSQGEPIHFDKTSARVGPGFAFAKLMAQQNPDVEVGLIPCAVGGTSIVKWKPDVDLFNKAVERARIAMKTGTLKGILWHQGESGSGNETKANRYGRDLASVAVGFRAALNAPDVPFIAGEIGQFLYTRSDRKAPFAKVINDQIDTLPKLVPNTAVVSSEGLNHVGDELHFDAESQRELGKRYFEAFRTLTGKQ